MNILSYFNQSCHIIIEKQSNLWIKEDFFEECLEFLRDFLTRSQHAAAATAHAESRNEV